MPKRYHLLALVRLICEDREVDWTKSKIYLLPKNEVKKEYYTEEGLAEYCLSGQLLDKIFRENEATGYLRGGFINPARLTFEEGYMGILNEGFLRCMECGKVREITKEWLKELCKQYFRERSPFALYDTDIKRFRCSKCGSKNIKYFAGAVSQDAKAESKEMHPPKLDIRSGVQKRYSPMHGHYGRGIRDEWKDK